MDELRIWLNGQEIHYSLALQFMEITEPTFLVGSVIRHKKMLSI